MKYNANKNNKLERAVFIMQITSSVMPILANIAIAVMAWMQHSWMMLAMVIPSIMMYAASLMPQILQYYAQKRAESANAAENYKVESNANAKMYGDNTISRISDYSQNITERIPDFVAPVSLETILFRKLSTLQLRIPPWKEVASSWLENKNPYKSLDTEIGIGNNGYVHLDLVNNGPHALVAGTTGSGKSVLLTTWCLSLAFRYSPNQLRFVFMDFKGGATFDLLSNLPHCMGNVGDLNLEHAARALRGLEMELDRRERLVAKQGCSDMSKVTPSQPVLVIMIDEFHALRDKLPDYLNRLIRIASVGRSLGMHLVACTQNPMAQVNADIKANINMNICLRVRDSVQSHELLGSSCAAHISPQLPGGAYYNTGDGIKALRCAQSNNPALLLQAIRLSGRFYHNEYCEELFSAPLPSAIKQSDIMHCIERNNKNTESMINNPIIGIQDDGIHLIPAFLNTHIGNIAVIGGHGRGKTNLLRIIAKHLQTQLYCATDTSTLPDNYDENKIIIVDDADMSLNPLNSDFHAQNLQSRISSSKIPVILGIHSARFLRIPDQAPVRIVFPTGDTGTDALLGIPSSLSQSLTTEDYQLPGRCVIITPGSARKAQILIN